MNDNAMTKPSTIKIKKTSTAKIPDNVGFPKFTGEGYQQPLDEQLSSMEKNGYKVERTSKGILITPNFNK